METLDWSLVADRLLRYYFPLLVLMPVLLGIICFDKRVEGSNKRTVLILCLMMVTLILVDVFDYTLSLLTVRSVWRLICSVLGFCLRPMCLLALLLESVSGIRQNKKKLMLLCLPAGINTLVFCTAFFSPLAFEIDGQNDYTRGPLFFVVIVVSVLYMILLAYNAIRNVRRRSRRKAVTILIMTAVCFLAAVMEMQGVVYPTPLLNQTIAIGTILYFLLSYMSHSADTIENMQLSLLLMQIRPHFINNSLAAIRGMIRRDPEKAVDALNHFSGYLQDSMHSILKTSLIPLSKEMELIDNYLYMENTRFRDSITVIKELAPVDFPVPPLTVQPLVENAVRHGLRGIQTPGRLILRTETDSREYRVIVTDNGCGFDTAQPPDPSREHVGLKNVCTRLELMCGGTLEIRSTPGSGTTATVHIPAGMMTALQNGAADPEK